MANDYIVSNCPHCDEYIFIYLKEFKCKIFRHGAFKTTLKQIEPHLPKNECDRLKKADLIYGCGKPFHLIEKEGKIVAEICDYI